MGDCHLFFVVWRVSDKFVKKRNGHDKTKRTVAGDRHGIDIDEDRVFRGRKTGVRRKCAASGGGLGGVLGRDGAGHLAA